MLYENIITQSLVSNNHKLYFYNHYNKEKHRNDIEIDFIITNQSKLNTKIYPIEVKSSNKYTTISIDKFINKYKQRIEKGYIIHPKNLSVKDNIIYLPSYMVFCI